MSEMDVVRREYATEDRFLERRLAAKADLEGPIVEDVMIATLRHLAPRRLLDVGCGTGDVTQRVRDEAGVDLVAMDLSPRMVELTRARRIDAHEGDVQSLSFADDQFDAVLANRMLYHVPDLDRALAEIVRVLRPGGWLVAVTYFDTHLAELWGMLPPTAHPPLPFLAENGAALLASRFGSVQRHDVSGTATFRTVEAVSRFFSAHGEFATYSPAEVEDCLGRVQVPLTATYRHCVFTAS